MFYRRLRVLLNLKRFGGRGLTSNSSLARRRLFKVRPLRLAALRSFHFSGFADFCYAVPDLMSTSAEFKSPITKKEKKAKQRLSPEEWETLKKLQAKMAGKTETAPKKTEAKEKKVSASSSSSSSSTSSATSSSFKTSSPLLATESPKTPSFTEVARGSISWKPELDKVYRLAAVRLDKRDKGLALLTEKIKKLSAEQVQGAVLYAKSQGKSPSVPTDEKSLEVFKRKRYLLQGLLGQDMNDADFSMIYQGLSSKMRDAVDAAAIGDSISHMGHECKTDADLQAVSKRAWGEKLIRKLRSDTLEKAQSIRKKMDDQIKEVNMSAAPILERLWREYPTLKPADTTVDRFLSEEADDDEAEKGSTSPPAGETTAVETLLGGGVLPPPAGSSAAATTASVPVLPTS